MFLILQFVVNSVSSSSAVISYDQRPSSFGSVGRLVKKKERVPVASTEYGAISAVDIEDGTGRHNFHLQFITLEPNALFLPVLLHSDMVFFVHTGKLHTPSPISSQQLSLRVLLLRESEDSDVDRIILASTRASKFFG